MILPTAEDVLQTIEATLETVLRPALSGTVEQSAAVSIGHLLRHVRLRLAREGQILLDNMSATRPLLAEIATFFSDIGETDAAARIEAALARPSLPVGTYPTLTDLGGAAGLLRRELEVALARLQALRATHGEVPEYLRLRIAIRTWIAGQLQAEAELIEPAFSGRGPRR